jgi:uncharacterized membrane protein
MPEWDDPVIDPRHYINGIFYYNPEDFRVLVPKRIAALGWTLNFANHISYIVILIIIIFPLVSIRLKR